MTEWVDRTMATARTIIQFVVYRTVASIINQENAIELGVVFIVVSVVAHLAGRSPDDTSTVLTSAVLRTVDLCGSASTVGGSVVIAYVLSGLYAFGSPGTQNGKYIGLVASSAAIIVAMLVVSMGENILRRAAHLPTTGDAGRGFRRVKSADATRECIL